MLLLRLTLLKSPAADLYMGILTGPLFPFAIMNTTVQSETELSSVNSILMAIGQAPITRIYEKKVYQDPNTSEQLIYTNPEVLLFTKYCWKLVLMFRTRVGCGIEKVIIH